MERVSASEFGSFNAEQRLPFDMFIQHYKAVLNGGNPALIWLQVDGGSGTGKSHVIRLLSARLDKFAVAHGQLPPVVHVGPTGVAANNINCGTIHSLHIPVLKSTSDLPPLGGSQFRYFIIDEKSMIGLRVMSFID